MTPIEFKAIRLGLLVNGRPMTQAELARVMGYNGQSAISFIESSRPREGDTVPKQAARLIRAYEWGYRPDSWPGAATLPGKEEGAL